MGAYLSQPNTDKHSEDGEGPGGLQYGVSEMQGWRMHMEVCVCVYSLFERKFRHDVPELVRGLACEATQAQWQTHVCAWRTCMRIIVEGCRRLLNHTPQHEH